MSLIWEKFIMSDEQKFNKQIDEYIEKAGIKFDFQNMDSKLYVALYDLAISWVGLAEDAGFRDAANAGQFTAAMVALAEYRNHLGPMPDWAVDRNWTYQLIPGAQLLTKDGRRSGNGYIQEKTARIGSYKETVYMCITDKGNTMTLTEQEIHEMFHIGDYLLPC